METLRIFENSRLGERFREVLLAGRMRVVVHEKPGFKRTFALAIARFGGADLMLPDGTPVPQGVAHFFEHRMFTKLDGDISRRFGALGMSVNAATGHARTAYHTSGSGNLAQGVELLLELVFAPHFPADGIESERQIIAREIAEHYQQPGTKLIHALHDALYHAHPVRHEILGTLQTLSDITPTMLYRCHETFYCPENMIFFIYGHRQEDETLLAMEKFLLEDLATFTGAAVPLAAVEEPLAVASARTEIEHRVVRPHVALAWKCSGQVPTGAAYLEETIATQVALDLVFGASSDWYERCYASRIVDETFEASYPHDIDYGYILVGGETADPDGFEGEVRTRVADMRRNGVAQEDLDRVKRRLAGSYIRQFNTPEDALGLFANYHVVGADALGAAEIADSLAVARIEERLAEIFAPGQTAVVVMRPRSGAR